MILRGGNLKVLRKQKEQIITAEIVNYRNASCFGYTKEKLKRLIKEIDNTILCCGTYNYSSENFTILKKIREEAYAKYINDFKGKIIYKGLDLVLE